MQDIDSGKTSETNDKIEHHISNNLKGVNEQSRNYIKDIVALINKEIGINKIVSILLFGSQQVEKENTIVSDCDLLFIFKNRVSSRHIKEIERYFIALEIKHNFKEPTSNLTREVLSVIQRSTGMFVSHFLTKQKYWEQGIFYKIFRVNRVFSALFAPRNIVLGNVIQNSTILYGDDLRNILRPKIKISVREIFRSTVMNLFISFFALLIGPNKELNSIKYQLEALKWSLKASNYYCYEDSEPLDKIVKRFISFEKPRKRAKAERFYLRFLELRQKPSNNLKFMLHTPFRILRIHMKAILFRKLTRRKITKKPSEAKEQIAAQRYFPLTY
jgi:predicted nucleotidyltransferase